MFGFKAPEIPDVLSKRMPGVYLPKLKVSQASLAGVSLRRYLARDRVDIPR